MRNLKKEADEIMEKISNNEKVSVDFELAEFMGAFVDKSMQASVENGDYEEENEQ